MSFFPLIFSSSCHRICHLVLCIVVFFLGTNLLTGVGFIGDI